jgi:hypothetical protein
VVEVHECVLGPKPFAKLLSRDHLPGLRQQHRQYLEGLLLKLDLVPALVKLARAQVERKDVKTQSCKVLTWLWHAIRLGCREYTINAFHRAKPLLLRSLLVHAKFTHSSLPVH